MRKSIDNFCFPGALTLSLFAFCCLLLPFDSSFSSPGFSLFYTSREMEAIFLFYAVIATQGLNFLVGLFGCKFPSFSLKIVLLCSSVLSAVFLAGLMSFGVYGIGACVLLAISICNLGICIGDIRSHYYSGIVSGRSNYRR